MYTVTEDNRKSYMNALTTPGWYTSVPLTRQRVK